MTGSATPGGFLPLGFRGQPIAGLPINMRSNASAPVNNRERGIHVVGGFQSLHFAAGVAPFDTIKPIDRMEGMFTTKAFANRQIQITVIQ
jgi:hypothetical protein